MNRNLRLLWAGLLAWCSLGYVRDGMPPPRRQSILTALTDETEVAKLFNRMCDKYLLLDVPGAGTPGMINCCHGGCDNCDFSHVFDEMTSGRPKWVALYPYRRHQDGRDHTAPWSRLFSSDGGRISEIEFVERFPNLPCVGFSMGPSTSVSPSDPPSRDALLQLWSVLVRNGGGVDETTISAEEMANALKASTGAEHGAVWGDVVKMMSRC